MSKKIGEVLIEKGLLTRAQLDKALKAQLILGGHLGTCLIELNYVDEEAFGRTLSAASGLPYATPEHLRSLRPSVVHALSWKLVEKHRVVPIALEDKTLHVAVIDPKNLDGLASKTGFRIVPWIAPEVRVFEAMERYYDIPRRPRYITICHELDRDPRRQSATRERSEWAPAAGEPRIGVDAKAAGTKTAEDLGAEYGYGKSWREIVDGDGADPAAAPRAPVQIATASNAELATLSEALCSAAGKDDLSAAVMSWAANAAKRVMLFAVRAETASPWDWAGLELERDRAAALRFPVTSGSVFTLMLGAGHYRGAVPDELECRWFFGALQIDVPDEILLVPAYLNDRLVAILYADGGNTGRIAGSTDVFRVVMQRVGLALNVLILKMKIRSD